MGSRGHCTRQRQSGPRRVRGSFRHRTQYGAAGGRQCFLEEVVPFADPDKTTLYVVGSGAEDANGQPILEGPQQTAATIYKLPMIAQGVKGRAK